MKKTICIFLALMLCHTAFTQGKFVIEGDIANLPDSTQIIVYNYTGTVLQQKDILNVTDGKFRYEGLSAEQPEQYALSLHGRDHAALMGCMVWAWNNHTTITGDSIMSLSWIANNDLPRQKELNAYILAAKEQLDEFTLVVYDMHRAQMSQVRITRPVMDSLMAICDHAYIEANRRYLELMPSMPVSEIMMEKLLSIAHYIDKAPDMREAAVAQYERLDEQQRKTIPAMTTAAKLFPEQTVGVGDLMADGELRDLNGNPRRLAMFKGKYILLDFWSVGCSPCRMAEPEIKKIFETYSDKVAVVGISTDDVATWKEYDRPVAWHNLSDGKQMGGIVAKYGVTPLPTYVLIDPQGIIVARQEGYAEGILINLLKEHKAIE